MKKFKSKICYFKEKPKNWLIIPKKIMHLNRESKKWRSKYQILQQKEIVLKKLKLKTQNIYH